MTTELTMTPFRATALLRRFKHDEKMLGPNEQAAIDFAISAITALTQRPAAHPTTDELESAAKVCDGFAAPDMAAALRGQRPAAQTEREALAKTRAFALATIAAEEFVRCNGLPTGQADEFLMTGPDLTDEHATACIEHLKHVGECVAFDCDDGVLVRLGDFTLGSLA